VFCKSNLVSPSNTASKKYGHICFIIWLFNDVSGSLLIAFSGKIICENTAGDVEGNGHSPIWYHPYMWLERQTTN